MSLKLPPIRRLFDEQGKGEPLSPCCNAVVFQDFSSCTACGNIVDMPFYFASRKEIPDEKAIVKERELRAKFPKGTAVVGLISILLLCCLSGCETVPKKSHSFRARVTFYHPHEDKWGTRTASGHRAHEGRTVAAGWWAPFGERLQIPQLHGVVGDGNFVVEDRGGAVEKAKASRGALPVVDVFVASRQKYRRCRDNCAPVMEVSMP
jgi:hypothetical protein